VSPLVFALKEKPPQRCDLSPLTPDRLAGTGEAIAAIEIQTTKRRLCVGDIFDVTPGDAQDIRFEGGSDRFDGVGAGMSHGRITIVGDVGQELGRLMRGGTIAVAGTAGRLAGSGMSGGRVDIEGDAGDLAGAPLPGEASGMKGGILRIKGSAGIRAGDRMRRGLIVIEQAAGEALASRMIGGTVTCFGGTGARPGYLMKRGTVILGKGPAEVTPTFVDSGVHELVAMRLIARWLIDEGIEGGSLLAYTMRRLVGDTAVLGKGEILVPVDEPRSAG
jgi:formylmethanofuran dehydrogenase subunit C